MRSAVAGTSFFCNGKKGGAMILAGSQAYSRLMKPIRMEPILFPNGSSSRVCKVLASTNTTKMTRFSMCSKARLRYWLANAGGAASRGPSYEYQPASFTISETTEKRPRGCSTSSFPVGLSAICQRFQHGSPPKRRLRKSTTLSLTLVGKLARRHPEMTSHRRDMRLIVRSAAVTIGVLPCCATSREPKK